jgi:hypothetical protein
MTTAYHRGKLIDGEELDRAISGHYREQHTKLPGFESEAPRLPILNVSTESVIIMMRQVSQGKGIVLDGVS